MRSDSSFFAFISHALIDPSFHTLDELGSRQTASRLDSPTQPSIDDAAHAFKHAPQQAFRERLFSPFLYYLLILELLCRIVRVGHECKYEFSLQWFKRAILAQVKDLFVLFCAFLWQYELSGPESSLTKEISMLQQLWDSFVMLIPVFFLLTMIFGAGFFIGRASKKESRE